MYHCGHHGNGRRSRSANAADIIGEQIPDDAAARMLASGVSMNARPLTYQSVV
jgi:hypothetical protein